MEIYVAYKDYLWMMGFTEQLLERISTVVNGTTELTIDGRQISFKAPFRRVTMTDAIREKTGYDITGQSEEQLREACKRLNVETDETMGKGKLIDASSASTANRTSSSRRSSATTRSRCRPCASGTARIPT